jgi:exopolysaccharide production protein ExoZ
MHKDRLLGIQYLRALAALMVAYYHVTLQIPAYTRYLAATGRLQTDYFSEAVPVFFVISGFVMYISAIDSKPLSFAWRRLARIVPLYWSLTLVIAVVALLAPGVLHHVIVSPAYLAKSLLFVPYRNPAAQGQMFPILGPGWSLDYEMFFYAVFALALLAPARWRLPGMCLVMLGLFGWGQLVPQVRAGVCGAVYTSPLLVTFATGMVIGWLYRRGSLRVHPAAACGLMAVGFVVLICSGIGEWARSGLAPASIVLGAVSLDARDAVPSWNFPRGLGDASYSIYLAHLFAFDAVSRVWTRIASTGPISAVCFAVTSMALAVGLAFLTYRLIERPTLRLLSGIRFPSARKIPRVAPTN